MACTMTKPASPCKSAARYHSVTLLLLRVRYGSRTEREWYWMWPSPLTLGGPGPISTRRENRYRL